MNPQVYKQKNITFVLTDERIVITTALQQSFSLEPKAHYWKRRLVMIRTLIELGEVRDLNELASWTNPGIEWQTTTRKYELENLGVLA